MERLERLNRELRFELEQSKDTVEHQHEMYTRLTQMQADKAQKAALPPTAHPTKERISRFSYKNSVTNSKR